MNESHGIVLTGLPTLCRYIKVLLLRCHSIADVKQLIHNTPHNHTYVLYISPVAMVVGRDGPSLLSTSPNKTIRGREFRC